MSSSSPPPPPSTTNPHYSCSPEPPPNFGPNGFDTQSDVYKMLQDEVEPVSEPKQSGSFRYLQEILEAEDSGGGGGGEKAPPQAAPSAAPLKHLLLTVQGRRQAKSFC